MLNLIAILTLATAPASVNLEACYQQALSHTVTERLSNAGIDEVEASFRQTLGTSLPQISLKASEFLQDDPGISGTSVPNSFTRTDRPEVSLNAKQSLFRGFKEFRALQAAKLQGKKLRYDEAVLKRQLYLEVATAYLTVDRLTQEQQTLVELLEVMNKRENELKRRVALGKARAAEELSQRTDLTALEAESLELNANLATAYDLLAFYTGWQPHPPIESLAGKEPTTSVTLESMLSRLPELDSMQSAEMAIAVAEQDLDANRADYWPTIDAEANYYLYRVAYQEDISWDAIFRLNLPLLQWQIGGNTAGAKARLSQRQLELIDARLRIERDLRQSFTQLKMQRQRSQLLLQSTQSAEKAYKLLINDYQRGAVSNLEVLQAQRTYLDVVRRLHAGRSDLWLRDIELRLRAELIPQQVP